MENILVLQGVSKKFGQQQALSDVSFFDGQVDIAQSLLLAELFADPL